MIQHINFEIHTEEETEEAKEVDLVSERNIPRTISNSSICKVVEYVNNDHAFENSIRDSKLRTQYMKDYKMTTISSHFIL